MNFCKESTKPTRRRILPVAFLTAIILSAVVFSASAEFQEIQLLRVINVGTQASATILGATTGQRLSGNGTSATFDVNLGNLRARAIAVGDVNGDGIPDVVVGAPEATFTVTPDGGAPQLRTGAGVAYVVFGESALSGAIDTGAGQANVSILGATSGDNLGFAVAVGDVNGDGIDDIAIGAPGANFPGAASPPPAARADTGAVFVIFGSATLGNPSTIDLATANAASVALFGVNSGDQFGTSVAVGNVGGLVAQTPAQQAVKDILIGAPGNDGPGAARSGAGAAYAQFGGEILNPVGGATTVFDLAATPANVVVFGKTGDALGASVATGDVNGGGSIDLILGAPLSERPATTGVLAATDTGAVFGVFGGVNLTPAVGTSKTFDIDAGQQNVSVYGATASDHLGVSVATGDVTGDGTADLLAGAPDADGPIEERPGAGEAYVVEGGAGLNPDVGSEKRIDLFGGGATLFGAASGDRLGSTVAAGNYNTAENSDSIPDLMVGAPGANGRAGIIAILLGGPNLLLLPNRDVLAGQDDLRILGQSGGNTDLSGKTLIIRQTLTSSDPATTPFLQRLTASINGNPPVVDDDTSAQFAVGTLTQVAAADTVIMGDTTALGNLQLAPMATSGNRVSSFTFPAATTAATSTIAWVQTAAAGTSVKIETSLDNGATFQTALNGGGIPSIAFGDELGWAIATGDVNNDQGGELIVGAPFANAVTGTGARTQAGVVYILPSTAVINQSPTVTVTAPNGGETLQVGQIFNITWNAADPNGDGTIQKFEIRLSTDGGANFNFTIAPNVAGTARGFMWTVPAGFNTTQGRIRVIVTDNQSATAQDDSNENFTITDVGVTASLTSPNGGETLIFGQQFTITWTVPDEVAASVKGFDLSLSTDGGVTFPIRIAPRGDPAEPALGPAVRSFDWNPVPSICTTTARVAVVTTSVANLMTSDESDANFGIAERGPTISTSQMFIRENFRLVLITAPPPGGTEVLFSVGTLVQVSSDAAGTTFHSFSKPNGKIKKQGAKYLSKGLINGQELGVFFPNGETRFIRITKPTCGLTLLRVTRSGEVLTPVPLTGAEPALQQRVWP